MRTPDLLEGIDLVVFDKDGTLIEFDLMWADWVRSLAAALAAALHLDESASAALGWDLHDYLGLDPATGRVEPHGLLAATPMSRIRDGLLGRLVAAGRPHGEATAAVATAWHAPDPVALARPVTDLPGLFGRLTSRPIRVAVATSDDRAPTLRTLEALGIAGFVEVIACADDGRPVKPAPDMVLAICGGLGIDPARTAVVGDSPADLAMGRAAGAGRVVGVLTGVGDRRTLGPLADAVVDSVADLA